MAENKSRWHEQETYLAKRISLFVRDSRDLREKRNGSDVSSSRVAPVAHVLLVSLTIHERRATCCYATPE